jgi:hypothetical protein
MKLYSDFFVGIRPVRRGDGLEFDYPEGAKPVMKHLYENGVWAIFSTLDPAVLQFKPGVLMTAPVRGVLERVERPSASPAPNARAADKRRVRRMRTAR